MRQAIGTALASHVAAGGIASYVCQITTGSMGFSYSEQGTYTLSNGTYLVSGMLFDSQASFVHSETVQQSSSRQGPNFQASFFSSRSSDSALTQASGGTGFSIGPQGTSATGTTSVAYTATGGYTLASSGSGSNATSSYASSLSQTGSYSSQFDSSGTFTRHPGGGSSSSASFSSANDFDYSYTVDLAGTRTSTISSSSFTRSESGSSAGSYTDTGSFESDGTSAAISGSYQLALAAQSSSSLQSSGSYSWAAGVGAVSGAFVLSYTASGSRSEAQGGSYSDAGTSGSFTSTNSTSASQQLAMSGGHSSPYIGSNYTYQQDSQLAAASSHTGTFYRGPAGNTTSGNINRTSSGTSNSSGQGSGYYSYSFPTGTSSGRGSGNWSQQVDWNAQESSSYTTTPTSHVLSGNSSRNRKSSFTETSSSSGSYASPVVMVLGVPTGTSGTYQEQRSSSGTSSTQENTSFTNPHTGQYTASGSFQSTSSGSATSSSSGQHSYVGIVASGTTTFVQQNSSQHSYSESGTLTANAYSQTRSASYTSQGQGTATAVATDAGSYGRYAPGGINGGNYSSWQNTNSRTQHTETGTYVAGPGGVYRSASFQTNSASDSQASSNDNPTYGSFRAWPTQGSMATSGSGSHQTQTNTARTTLQSGTSEWMGSLPIHQSVSFQTSESTSTTSSGQEVMGTVRINLPFNSTVTGSQASYNTHATVTLSENGTFVQQGTAAPTRTGSFSKSTWQQGNQSAQRYAVYSDPYTTMVSGGYSTTTRNHGYSENTSYVNDLHTGTFSESDNSSATSDLTHTSTPTGLSHPGAPMHTVTQRLQVDSQGGYAGGGSFTRQGGVITATDQKYTTNQSTSLSSSLTATATTSRVSKAFGAPTEADRPTPLTNSGGGIAAPVNVIIDLFHGIPWSEIHYENNIASMGGKPGAYEPTPYQPSGADQTLSFVQTLEITGTTISDSRAHGTYSKTGSDYSHTQTYSTTRTETEHSTSTDSMTAHYDAPSRKGLLVETITDETSASESYSATGTVTGGGSSMSHWSVTSETYLQKFTGNSSVRKTVNLSVWLDTGTTQHTHTSKVTETQDADYDGTYQGTLTFEMGTQAGGQGTVTSQSESANERNSTTTSTTITYEAGFGNLGTPSFSGGSGASGGSGGGSGGSGAGSAATLTPGELGVYHWLGSGPGGWMCGDMAVNMPPPTITYGFSPSDVLAQGGLVWAQNNPISLNGGSSSGGSSGGTSGGGSGGSTGGSGSGLTLGNVYGTTFGSALPYLQESYSAQASTKQSFSNNTTRQYASGQTTSSSGVYTVSKEVSETVRHTQSFQLDGLYQWEHEHDKRRWYTNIGTNLGGGSAQFGIELSGVSLSTFTKYTKTFNGSTQTLSYQQPPVYTSATFGFHQGQPAGWAWEQAQQAHVTTEDILDAVQTVLDVIGFLDPTGISDLVNAGISYARGDTQGALLNLVGAIPGIGDAIGKGAKLLSKAGGALKAAGKASDAVGGLGKLAGNAGEMLGKVADRTCDIATPLLRGTQMVLGAETVGIGIDQMRSGDVAGGALTIIGGIGAIAGARNTGACFTAGHQVLVGIVHRNEGVWPTGAAQDEQAGTGAVVIDRDKVLVGPGEAETVAMGRSQRHHGWPSPADGDFLSALLAGLGLDDFDLARLGLWLNPAAWSIENRAAGTLILVGIGLAGHAALNSRRRAARDACSEEVGGPAPGPKSQAASHAGRARRMTRRDAIDRIHAQGFDPVAEELRENLDDQAIMALAGLTPTSAHDAAREAALADLWSDDDSACDSPALLAAFARDCPAAGQARRRVCHCLTLRVKQCDLPSTFHPEGALLECGRTASTP